MKTLLNKFWSDDCGGIITAEYLLLGSILTLGTISGMMALRDATVAEMVGTGQAIRQVREHQHQPFQPPFVNNTGIKNLWYNSCP